MLQVLFFVSSVSSQTPASPLWPNTFWQQFNEERVSSTTGSHHNYGTYYYDYTVPAFRVDRSNGQYDAVCGGGPHASVVTPCNQFVVGGNRFVYYPDFNDCYFCCNSTEGCGMLKPTWMSNAVYIDTEMHNGVLTYKWLVQGNQQNFIYETVATNPTDRVTISLYEEPDDFFDFYRQRNSVIPAGTFNLPSACNLQKTAQWGLCGAENPVKI